MLDVNRERRSCGAITLVDCAAGPRSPGQPTHPSSLRRRYAASVSLVALAAAFTATQPQGAQAANECGVGAVVTCTANSYAG
jgi:hypothetical protein